MNPSPIVTDRHPAGARAFSLVELLTVVAVMAVLMSILAPAFKNIGGSSLLGAEGNRVVTLIQHAAQNSASRNAMTALIAIPSDPDRPASFDAFGLFERAPDSGEWRQLTRWETLKDGVVVDYPTGQAAQFSDYPAMRPTPDFPTITHRGRTVSSFRYVIFLPNRSLLQNLSAQLRLAEGFFEKGSPTPTFTRRAPSGDPLNYYQVTILGATGRTRVDRP